MRRAKVYRNLGRAQSLWGLEPFDALGLAVLLWLVLTLNRGAFFINLTAVFVAYLALRLVKRGKPPGYTTSVARYVLRRRSFLAAAVPDARGREHPFPLPSNPPVPSPLTPTPTRTSP